jgi:hypothetical protein
MAATLGVREAANDFGETLDVLHVLIYTEPDAQASSSVIGDHPPVVEPSIERLGAICLEREEVATGVAGRWEQSARRVGEIETILQGTGMAA